MQKIINQIYWDTTNDTYLSGTHLKKTANNRVYFKNNLMSPGKKIVKWHSSVNYQAAKEIPRLPMLINGHEYIINIKNQVYPEMTCTYRFHFYNLQGEIVQTLFFNENEYEFTFPKDAVSYTFEIVNAGCTKLNFERIQISEKNLPERIFADVYYGKKFNKEISGPLNLVLIADGKRSRRIETELEDKIPVVPLQLAHIAWQYEGNLVQELGDWVSENIDRGCRIISSSPKFDLMMEKIKTAFPQISVVTSTELAFNTKKTEVNEWYSPNICDPDWLLIAQEIKDYFRM